jgi:mono/diheme cytochrome c family protein
MKHTTLLIRCVLGAASVMALAQESRGTFAPEAVKRGSDIFARNCAPCHGARMTDPEAAFDLRKLTSEQKDRFVTSVTKGRNAMPPWGDILNAQDVEALWAYVMVGER